MRRRYFFFAPAARTAAPRAQTGLRPAPARQRPEPPQWPPRRTRESAAKHSIVARLETSVRSRVQGSIAQASIPHRRPAALLHSCSTLFRPPDCRMSSGPSPDAWRKFGPDATLCAGPVLPREGYSNILLQVRLVRLEAAAELYCSDVLMLLKIPVIALVTVPMLAIQPSATRLSSSAYSTRSCPSSPFQRPWRIRVRCKSTFFMCSLRGNDSWLSP